MRRLATTATLAALLAVPLATQCELTWRPTLSFGGANGFVLALTASGADLFAGGAFTAIGDAVATNVARWDGAHW